MLAEPSPEHWPSLAEYPYCFLMNALYSCSTRMVLGSLVWNGALT
jgi:hypothetical protein